MSDIIPLRLGEELVSLDVAGVVRADEDPDVPLLARLPDKLCLLLRRLSLVPGPREDLPLPDFSFPGGPMFR